MTALPAHLVRSARAALAAVVLTGALTAVAAGPAAAEKSLPQLSITVDDGRADVTTDARLTYTVTVTNLGARPVKDLEVTQTVPTGAKPVSAKNDATVRGQQVVWRSDLRPAQTKRFTSRVDVAATTPADLLRLATIACATPAGADRPLVCASDSDQLPAGAAADSRRATVTTAAPASVTTSPRTVPVAGAALLAGVLAVGAFLLSRRLRAPGHTPRG